MSNNKASTKPKQSATGKNLSKDLVNEYCGDTLTVEKCRKDLDSMFLTARNMLIESAKTGTLLKNVDAYKANLSTEEYITLEQSACILVKDLTQYKNRLDEIKESQNALPWDSEDVMDVQQPSFSIYENYNEWIHSYSTVVLPEIATIHNLITLAAKNANAQTKE